MKKPSAIQLSIPEPCTQAWDDMQPVQGGRHCASCQKTVVDFTRMTDAQVLDYFQKATGSACGRLATEQMDRAIKTVEVRPSNWWTKLAAGVFLMLGLSKNADGQVKDQRTETRQTPINNQQDSTIFGSFKNQTSTDSLAIVGTLIDERNNPIVNANVEISQNGSLIGNCVTDFDGKYEMALPSNQVQDTLVVKFTFLSSVLVIKNISSGEKIRVADGKMSIFCRMSTSMGALMIAKPPMNLENPGASQTITKDRIQNGNLR